MLTCGNTFVTLHSFTAQNSVEIYIFENISFSEDENNVLLKIDIKLFDAVCSGSQISHNLIEPTNKL